jgi:polygalacturonase
LPARDFEITRYGAKPDEAANSSDAIREAIAACSAAGGGRVVVPPSRTSSKTSKESPRKASG